MTEDLDTAVTSLTVNNGLTGDIVIDQTGALQVNGDGIVNQNADGSISINVTTGTLTIDAPLTSPGDISITAPEVVITTAVTSETGDVTVTATDTDVVLEGETATIQTDTGHVTVTAEEDVLLTVIESGGTGITITANNGSIVDNLPGEDSNLVTPGILQIAAGKDIGQSGEANINIDAGTLNIGFFDGDNISVEFEDGREFSGSAENLYFITSKRDFEPHITSRLTPDSLRQNQETASEAPTIQALIEDERLREFLGELYPGTREAGSVLQQNAEQLRMSLSILASGAEGLAEDYNQALAAELQRSLERIAEQ